jgi:hypothetical protein
LDAQGLLLSSDSGDIILKPCIESKEGEEGQKDAHEGCGTSNCCAL